MISTHEEERIRATWQKLAEAWSAGDHSAAASAWTMDCDHRQLGPSTTRRCGRAELERCLAEAFSRRRGERRLNCNIGTIRLLQGDVAIVDGVLEVTTPGTSQPVLAEAVSAVMTKRNEVWLIAASRVSPPARVTAGQVA